MNLQFENHMIGSDSTSCSTLPSLYSFMAYLRTLEQMLLQANNFNYANHYLFATILRVIQSAPLSRNAAVLGCSFMYLNLNMRKISTGQCIVAYIEELLKSLNARVELLEEEEHARRSSAESSSGLPVKDLKKHWANPKFILRKPTSEETFPLLEFERLPEKRIGTIYF